MIVQFQESKVSDTVNEFRAFYISRSYLWESLYWLSPCAILVAGIVLAPSTILFTLLGFAILLMSWLFSSQVVEESVLIIKDFGIQLRIKYRTGSEETKVFIRTLCALTFVVNWPTIPFFIFEWWYNLFAIVQFLDKDKISGVIVHEAIVGSSVQYELAFLMRDEPKLSISFAHLYPGLANLRRVYKACAEMSSNIRSRGKRWYKNKIIKMLTHFCNYTDPTW